MVATSSVESPEDAASVPPVTTRGGRLEWLDSIRGLAALVVLIGHIAGAFKWPDWARNVFLLFDGRVAVTMFFVLSGFVLARPYLGEVNTSKRFLLANFLTRRVTRIWLPWVAVFWMSWLAREFLPRDFLISPTLSEWAASFWTRPQDAMTILKQHLYSLHDPMTVLLPQDWTLRVELQGSALIPVFVWLFRRRPWLVAAFGTALLFVPRPFGYYMVTFAAGVLIAGYRNEIQKFFATRSRATLIGLLLLAIILIETRYIIGPPKATDRFVWNLGTVGCSLFLALALGSSQLQSLLSRTPLVFLGRISYSLYLIQFVVILCALPPLIYWLNNMGLSEPNALLALVMFFGIAITIVLSAVLHHWIEQPCIDLGHWLGKFLRF
jgi:peptidoglycan/LPS O-acetylase OafA/YrhL